MKQCLENSRTKMEIWLGRNCGCLWNEVSLCLEEVAKLNAFSYGSNTSKQYTSFIHRRMSFQLFCSHYLYCSHKHSNEAETCGNKDSRCVCTIIWPSSSLGSGKTSTFLKVQRQLLKQQFLFSSLSFC